MDAERSARGRAKNRMRYLELSAAVILASAGSLAGWSSYQASAWGGVQSREYNRASALRIESTRAATAADALRAIDVAMFGAWLEAYATEMGDLAAFYRARFRAEFRPAFEEWIASEPRSDPNAAPSPFALDIYRLAESRRADELAETAELAFREGTDANTHSDAFVLNAALLATVLVLAGIAHQFRLPYLQALVLVVAAGLLAVGIYNAVVLPKL